MADLSLKYLLYGEDKSASSSIKGVGSQATSTASLISGGFSKMGSMVGGEVGDMLNRISSGFDTVGEKSKGMSAKVVMGGTAIMGLGLAMQTMASKDIAAQKQLDAAVEATGKGYDAFGSQVEALVAKQVAFGHSDDEVKTALRTLTTAYNDPKKALEEMNLVTDLAAAKNISLEAAATTVAKAHGGAAKVFKEFGVQVGLNADGTKNYDGALTVLSGKLAGQATASMDTFGGKVQQVKTWLENQATAISEKYGPAVTIAGGAVTALGSVMQVLAARNAAAALAQTAETAALEGSTVAMVGATGAAERASVGIRGVAGAAGVALAAFVLLKAGNAGLDNLFGNTVPGANEAARALTEFADKGKASGDASQLINEQFGNLGDTLNNVFSSDIAHKANAFGQAIDPAHWFSESQTSTSKAIDFFKTLDSGLANMVSSGNAAKAADLYKRVADEATKQGYSISQVKDALPGYTAAIGTSGAAAGASVAPTKSLADIQKALADAAKAATDKINAYHQSLVDAGLVVLNQRDAQRQLKQSIQDATDAVTKNGATLNDNTVKGRDNATALDAVAKAATGQATAVFNSTHSEEAMRQSLLASRDSLVKTAEKFGMTKAQAGAYADSVLKIPPHQKTAVELAGIAKAQADADAFKRKLASIDRNVAVAVNITVSATTVGSLASTYASQVPKHAAGTPFFGGGLTWVGEQGPELVSLPRGSAIHSNGESMAMARSGSSSQAPAAGNGATSSDIKILGDRFGNELQRQARTIQMMQRQMAGAR